ncbi:MAG: hypothetical protein K2W82_07090 [Candidatus Obscuribacterales bacterium]|nr:hypothetical protein [Candidatus Obscuribacterales bacterium]
MFIYLLIAAELVLLYTAYWYLHLREPKRARRVASSTWGRYDYRSGTANGESQSRIEVQQLKPFMLINCDEMTFDSRRNHYVSIKYSPDYVDNRHWIAKLFWQLDNVASELNVRP